MNEPRLIEDLLEQAHTIAVVGYSLDPTRPSNSVSRYLRGQGFRIIPVNPRLHGAVIEGEQAYDRLTDIPSSAHVDLADIFRRGEFLDAVVDDVIAARIPAVWFQLGLGNDAPALRAERSGVRVVWDRCTAIEHRRLRRA